MLVASQLDKPILAQPLPVFSVLPTGFS